MPQDLTAFDEAIAVDADTVGEATRGLSATMAAAARFAARLHVGTLTAKMPDGRVLRFGGKAPGPDAFVEIHDENFARRTLKRGAIGVAEGYFAGEWSSPDISTFLELFCHNDAIITAMIEKQPLVRLWLNVRHWMNRNTRSGSKRNIHAHYDLGNRFYEKWLDHTMTYSAALFEPGDAGDLGKAQTRKYASLARKIGARPGDHVLEIGCGWGGFAEFAARELDCKVTGITISKEQHDFAKARMQKAGLNEKVDIRLQDYRDTTGRFDRIASIEMFEAVGEKYWPVFFDTVRERLQPGGVAGLQVITIQDKFFNTYRRTPDFIQRYVFPGGMLPSPSKLREAAEKAGLVQQDQKVFGHDYARTLASWRDQFLAAWPEIHPLGFDEHFKRLWEYYLSYCEAGFRSGNIDVRQVTFARH